MRKRLIDIKALHVMHYPQFDRSMGLVITNELYNGDVIFWLFNNLS